MVINLVRLPLLSSLLSYIFIARDGIKFYVHLQSPTELLTCE